jgi:hypothetical protein
MTTPIDLTKESYGRAVQVADGFWLLATRHHPGGSRNMPEINNRCVILRLHDRGRGQPVLCVVNGVDPAAMTEVRRLESETGLEVMYLISPGGGHHLLLPAWRDEFHAATVLVPPVRIPHTPSARKLMDGPRVQVMDPENPLPQFVGQLDAVVFRGLIGFRDNPSPLEGGPELGMFKMMREMMKMDSDVDEVWLHHVATDTVIGGENLGWILSAKTLKTFPLMMRMMMKPDTVFVQKQARKVKDRQVVAACWKQVLAWPSKTLIGYHEPPGEGFVGDGQAALRAAVAKAGQLFA